MPGEKRGYGEGICDRSGRPVHAHSAGIVNEWVIGLEVVEHSGYHCPQERMTRGRNDVPLLEFSASEGLENPVGVPALEPRSSPVGEHVGIVRKQHLIER